eukprot:3466019-Amphidinium_carterae.1
MAPRLHLWISCISTTSLPPCPFRGAVQTNSRHRSHSMNFSILNCSLPRSAHTQIIEASWGASQLSAVGAQFVSWTGLSACVVEIPD